MMEINITKKDYRLLLDMLAISDWVMNSHNVEDDPRTEPYERLEQKLFAFAKDFDCEDLVMYDKETGKYYPTAEYDEHIFDTQFIEEFEDMSFWEKLCSGLAQRDLIQEKGIEALKKMDTLERMTEEDARAEKYETEFSENSLKHLIISK
jgi:hypothetical protein